MNCENQTSPINIDINSITGKCDFKCKYNYNYNENNNINITNKIDHLSISYKGENREEVTYNTYKYSVKEVRLFTPSLHSYNGFKVEAELIIVHNPITGTKPLLVCLPIKKGDSASKSSIQLASIINSGPSLDDNSRNIGLIGFNLNLYIPKKPFFSYTGTNPYLPCGGNNDFIVYDAINSDIFISSNTFQKLKEVIKENGYKVTKNNFVYYNELGGQRGDGSNDIYIDCRPVGKSEEETLVVTDMDIKYPIGVLENPYVQIILGALLSVALILIANKIFMFFQNRNKSNSNIINNVIRGGRKLITNI
jgi:carbonic anhydrase